MSGFRQVEMSGLVWIKMASCPYQGGYIHGDHYIDYERVREVKDLRKA